MPKRPRFSRYRRLPPVFRLGEHKLPDADQEEQRLTLYVTGAALDLAEAQATRAGVETIQEYCAELLVKAIEAERAREHVAEVEARRGAMEGLNQIADDPQYLAEWSAQTEARELSGLGLDAEPALEAELDAPHSVKISFIADERPAVEISYPEDQEGVSPAEVVSRHAGQSGDDPLAFLPSLRRGEPVRLEEVAELARALQTLEERHRNAAVLDRRLAYALHRLAFESQILHTDAWPGAFDEWTVETLRAVQEYVDRILSGQDIRYYPAASHPENPI